MTEKARVAVENNGLRKITDKKMTHLLQGNAGEGKKDREDLCILHLN